MNKKFLIERNFWTELKKFFFIFILVFLILFFIFNFGSFWANIRYAFLQIFPGKTKFFGEATTIEKDTKDNDNIGIDLSKDIIFIPKIGVEAPIILPKGTTEKDFLSALKEGVVLNPEFSSPGSEGITVILGHSSPNIHSIGKYNNVFSLLNKLEKGDIITIYYQKQKYNYKVTLKYTFSPGEENLKVRDTKNSTLLLITCWPIGTNFRRLGVEAEFID